MIIEVVEKQPYGTPRIYPVNEGARKLAALLKAKTFSLAQLRNACDMGHTVRVIHADTFAKDLAKLAARGAA